MSFPQRIIKTAHRNSPTYPAEGLKAFARRVAEPGDAIDGQLTYRHFAATWLSRK